MKTSWKQAVEWVLEDEGGYADIDGGTNFGVRLATLRDWRNDQTLDRWAVRALSKAEAKEIYRARYWAKIDGDALPAGIDYVVMDGAVHSGPTQSILWLQRALDVADDGRMGPITLTAAVAADPMYVVVKALELRKAMLRKLSTWPTYGRGWSARLERVELRAPELWQVEYQDKPTFPLVPPAGEVPNADLVLEQLHTLTPYETLKRAQVMLEHVRKWMEEDTGG